MMCRSSVQYVRFVLFYDVLFDKEVQIWREMLSRGSGKTAIPKNKMQRHRMRARTRVGMQL